jgi:hypothetical protein
MSLRKHPVGSEEYVRHFMFIEAPLDIVGHEMIFWGKASWWPNFGTIATVRESENPLQLGTRFRHEIKKPFKQTWISEVVKYIPNRLIEWSLRPGMIKGSEVLKLEERANGTRLDYALYGAPSNVLNKFLWKLFVRKPYEEYTKRILLALRDHVTKSQERQNL